MGIMGLETTTIRDMQHKHARRHAHAGGPADIDMRDKRVSESEDRSARGSKGVHWPWRQTWVAKLWRSRMLDASHNAHVRALESLLSPKGHGVAFYGGALVCLCHRRRTGMAGRQERRGTETAAAAHTPRARLAGYRETARTHTSTRAASPTTPLPKALPLPLSFSPASFCVVEGQGLGEEGGVLGVGVESLAGALHRPVRWAALKHHQRTLFKLERGEERAAVL